MRKHTLLVVAVSLVSLAAGYFAQAQRQPAAAPGVERQKWEYLTYFVHQVGTSVQGPRSTIGADKPFDLYQKLGGKKRRDQFTSVDIPNLLGTAGWELAAVEEEGVATTAYTYKRPVLPGSE